MDTNDKIIERKRRIQEMFNGIAGRYDLLNHLLSGGIDVYWRRRALSKVRLKKPERVLDLATGTGDFALAVGRLGVRWVVGADVALNMVRLGKNKVIGRQPPVVLMGGDAEQLPFRAECFDLVTVAFGVRNFGSIAAGLAQAWRVLRPGGEMLILDFSEPTWPLFKQVYGFYFKRVLPLVGGLISGNRAAYAYLPQSVGFFPQGRAFLELMEEAGFVETKATALTLGIAHVYQGRKPVD
jgi:demethylmenaquinone methyltransferase/2-methoxy-6-polyprenyl-1,4-benzoquinol methylase